MARRLEKVWGDVGYAVDSIPGKRIVPELVGRFSARIIIRVTGIEKRPAIVKLPAMKTGLPAQNFSIMGMGSDWWAMA